MKKKDEIKKVVLAYSGGLDTSVIIPWLKENYNNCEVITVTADLGQGDDMSFVHDKALKSGASKAYVLDLRDEFLRDYAWPMVKSGAVYEKKYLLGTSIARPVIAKHLVEVALKENADAICHGATGKGNDQVRFELGIKALAPQLQVIAPWREWNIKSREDAIDFASAHNIPVPVTKKKDYSMDWNIWHLSHEGSDLEDPANEPNPDIYIFSGTPEGAPDKDEYVELEFVEGVPVAVNGKKMEPVELLTTLNEIGKRNGIGIADMVENRLVGHEVAHAVAKHSNERMSQQLMAQYGAQILGQALSNKSAAVEDRCFRLWLGRSIRCYVAILTQTRIRGGLYGAGLYGNGRL